VGASLSTAATDVKSLRPGCAPRSKSGSCWDTSGRRVMDVSWTAAVAGGRGAALESKRTATSAPEQSEGGAGRGEAGARAIGRDSPRFAEIRRRARGVGASRSSLRRVTSFSFLTGEGVGEVARLCDAGSAGGDRRRHGRRRGGGGGRRGRGRGGRGRGGRRLGDGGGGGGELALAAGGVASRLISGHLGSSRHISGQASSSSSEEEEEEEEEGDEDGGGEEPPPEPAPPAQPLPPPPRGPAGLADGSSAAAREGEPEGGGEGLGGMQRSGSISSLFRLLAHAGSSRWPADDSAPAQGAALEVLRTVSAVSTSGV